VSNQITSTSDFSAIFRRPASSINDNKTCEKTRESVKASYRKTQGYSGFAAVVLDYSVFYRDI